MAYTVEYVKQTPAQKIFWTTVSWLAKGAYAFVVLTLIVALLFVCGQLWVMMLGH